MSQLLTGSGSASRQSLEVGAAHTGDGPAEYVGSVIDVNDRQSVELSCRADRPMLADRFHHPTPQHETEPVLMRRAIALRAGLLVATSAAVVAVFAAPADAHVTITPTAAQQGGL